MKPQLVTLKVKSRLLWIFAALMFALALTCARPVHAQDERVTVRVDGRAVFRVGAAGEQDAATRARAIERRIGTLLQNPEAITPARVEASTTNPPDRIVTVASVPVVTVTEADAQENLVAVDALAAQWAEAVNQTLARGREERLSAWGRFRAEVTASVRTAFARLLESAITIIPRVFAAVLVILFFGGLALFVRWLIRVTFHRAFSDLTIENLVKQLAY